MKYSNHEHGKASARFSAACLADAKEKNYSECFECAFGESCVGIPFFPHPNKSLAREQALEVVRDLIELSND